MAIGLGDAVTVVGLSVGGAIAGWIAQRRTDVFRVALIAPAFAPGRITSSAEETGVLMEIAGRLPNIMRSTVFDTTRPDLAQGISTRGLTEVMKLGSLVRRDAASRPARVPRITVLLNENDNTVSGQASRDIATTWSESSSLVLLYQFPSSLRLPHNLMETTARGGNPELVNPVLQALAVGITPPDAARFQWLRCTSPGCR